MDYCCQCGEETGYKKGYEVWETFDGKYGHKWCVIQYDNANKTAKMKLEEEVRKLEGRIRHFDYEKKKCQEMIEKLRIEIKSTEID